MYLFYPRTCLLDITFIMKSKVYEYTCNLYHKDKEIIYVLICLITIITKGERLPSELELEWVEHYGKHFATIAIALKKGKAASA